MFLEFINQVEVQTKGILPLQLSRHLFAIDQRTSKMDLFGNDFVEVSDLGGINEEETHDPLSLFATCFNYIVNDPAPVLAEMERRGLTFQSLPTSLVQDILDSLAQPRKHQLWTPALLTNFFLALRNTTSPLTLSLSGIMREPVQMAFSNPDILAHVTSVTLTFPFYEEEDSSLLFEDKKFLQTLRLENWRRLTRLSIKGCPSLTNLLVVMVPSLLELVVDSESSSNLKSLNVPYCKSILFGNGNELSLRLSFPYIYPNTLTHNQKGDFKKMYITSAGLLRYILSP